MKVFRSASLVCIGLRDHFLCKFQIVSNDNQIRFLTFNICPSSWELKTESVYCMNGVRFSWVCSLILIRMDFTGYKPQETKKCPLKSVKFRFSKGHLNRDFVSLYFIHIAPFYQAQRFCENFLWRVDKKMGSEQSCRSITLQKIRIGLNQRREYVDKVIMALTMYDTFYNVN